MNIFFKKSYLTIILMLIVINIVAKELYVNRLYTDSIANFSLFELNCNKNEEIKQIALKARNINLDIQAGEGKKIQIFSNLETGDFVTKRKGIFSHLAKIKFMKKDKEFSSLLDLFKSKGKGMFNLKDTVIIKNKVSLKTKLSGFSLFDISLNGNAVALDFLKTENKLFVTMFIPKNVSLNIKAKEGELIIENINSEIKSKFLRCNSFLKNIEGVVDIDVKTGNLQIDKLKGILKIKTLAGEVNARDIDGLFDMKGLSGDIKVSKMEGVFKAKTSVGDIVLKGFKNSDISAKVTSGNVIIEDFENCKKVDITNSSGDISLKNGIANKLDISCKGGEIEINNFVAVMNIKVTTGYISLLTNKFNFLKKNHISLKNGDINITVNNNKAIGYFDLELNKKLLFKNPIYSSKNVKLFEFEKGKNSEIIDCITNNGKVTVKFNKKEDE